MGEGFFEGVVASLVPCFVGEVFAEVAGGLGIWEDGGDDGLSFGKRGVGGGAASATGAEVP